MKITWILKSSLKTCFTSGCVNFLCLRMHDVTRMLAAASFLFVAHHAVWRFFVCV